MSQHDYSIANQLMPAARTDINNVLAAILSNNSGATEPSTTAGCMPWADTTDNLLKIRNPGDSAWIYLLNLDTDVIPTAKTGTYNVAVTDYRKLIPCNANGGGFTVNLPAAATAGEGFRVGVIKTDSTTNAVTIDGDSSETINGGTTLTLNSQYDVIVLISDGSNWYAEGGFRVATQAQMEAETAINVAIRPDRVKYSPGVAKAWVQMHYSAGTPTIDGSYNVSSLTDTNTGDFNANYTTSMSGTTSVCVLAQIEDAGYHASVRAANVAYMRIRIYNTSNSAADASGQVHAAAWGDQ